MTICVSSLDPFSSPFQPKKITWIQKAWLGTTSHWAGGIVTMLWLYGEHALMCPFPLYICSCNRAVVMCNCCCEMLEQAHHYHIVISIRKEWQCAFTQESIILSSNWPASKSFKCVEMAIIFMIVIKRLEHKSIFFYIWILNCIWTPEFNYGSYHIVTSDAHFSWQWWFDFATFNSA